MLLSYNSRVRVSFTPTRPASLFAGEQVSGAIMPHFTSSINKTWITEVENLLFLPFERHGSFAFYLYTFTAYIGAVYCFFTFLSIFYLFVKNTMEKKYLLDSSPFFGCKTLGVAGRLTRSRVRMRPHTCPHLGLHFAPVMTRCTPVLCRPPVSPDSQ